MSSYSVNQQYVSLSTSTSQSIGPTREEIQAKLEKIRSHGGPVNGRSVDQAMPLNEKNISQYTNNNPLSSAANKAQSQPNLPKFRASLNVSTPSHGAIPIPSRPGASAIPIPPRPGASAIPIPPRPGANAIPIPPRPQRSRSASLPSAGKYGTSGTSSFTEIDRKLTDVKDKLTEVRNLRFEVKLLEFRIKEFEKNNRKLRRTNPSEYNQRHLEIEETLEQKKLNAAIGLNRLINVKNELNALKSSGPTYQKKLEEAKKKIETQIKKDFFIKSTEIKTKIEQIKLNETNLSELEGAINEVAKWTVQNENSEADYKKELDKVTARGKSKEEIIKEMDEKNSTTLNAETKLRAFGKYPEAYPSVAFKRLAVENSKISKEQAMKNLQVKLKEVQSLQSTDPKLMKLQKEYLRDADEILTSSNQSKTIKEWYERHKTEDALISGFAMLANETFGNKIPWRTQITKGDLWKNSLSRLAERDKANSKNFGKLEEVGTNRLIESFNAAQKTLTSFYFKEKDQAEDEVTFKADDDPVWTLTPQQKNELLSTINQLQNNLRKVKNDVNKIQFSTTSKSPDEPSFGRAGETAKIYVTDKIAGSLERLEKLKQKIEQAGK